MVVFAFASLQLPGLQQKYWDWVDYAYLFGTYPLSCPFKSTQDQILEHVGLEWRTHSKHYFLLRVSVWFFHVFRKFASVDIGGNSDDSAKREASRRKCACHLRGSRSNAGSHCHLFRTATVRLDWEQELRSHHCPYQSQFQTQCLERDDFGLSGSVPWRTQASSAAWCCFGKVGMICFLGRLSPPVQLR